MFMVRVLFSSQASQSNDLALAAGQVQTSMLAAPGCRTARFFAEVGKPEQLMLYQEWESEAAFQSYAQSSSFKENGGRLAPFIASAPDTKRFRLHDLPAEKAS